MSFTQFQLWTSFEVKAGFDCRVLKVVRNEMASNINLMVQLEGKLEVA